ncbi:unnamed protein product [Arctia plantaginis]|uniref:Pacifastin domain-containing protein n=1 Tax=Arctia plantaginis TaxID=874455 RepID=A0A8S1BCN1_ARCPL|nr:unnamed protein product [Arctia plantaginis]CAB3260545.1 unnamed protein product [Arctia plantaginis]
MVLPFVQMKAPLDEDMFLYWRRSEPSKCEPFTTHMINCNKCVCSADGTSYCTRMVCINKDDMLDKSEEGTQTDAYTDQDDSR